MGTFAVKVVALSPTNPARRVEVECWVDTGALYSQLPAALIRELGLSSMATRPFLMADGRQVTSSLGEARFLVDGREATTIVIFGHETAPPLLGAVTLESLGLGVDPANKRLIPIVAPMFLAF